MMRRFMTLFIALLLPTVLIMPASANSAQTHWSGVDSAGAIVREEHSPVVVEKVYRKLGKSTG